MNCLVSFLYISFHFGAFYNIDLFFSYSLNEFTHTQGLEVGKKMNVFISSRCDIKWFTVENHFIMICFLWVAVLCKKKGTKILGQRNHITCSINTSLTLTFWTAWRNFQHLLYKMKQLIIPYRGLYQKMWTNKIFFFFRYHFIQSHFLWNPSEAACKSNTAQKWSDTHKKKREKRITWM